MPIPPAVNSIVVKSTRTVEPKTSEIGPRRRTFGITL